MAALPQTRGLKSSFEIETKHEAFYTGGCIQVSKDGQKIFCRCNGKIEILSVNTGKVEGTIQKDESDEVTTFAVSNNDQVLVAAIKNGLLNQWDLSTNKCTRTWKSLHSGPIAKMCFDVTNTLLATGGTDSSIKVWDVIKQYCTHNLRGGQGVYSVVQFHPDIIRLQIFGAIDGVIRAWDLNTSQVVATFENGHFSRVTALQFTENGNHMFSCGRDSVVIMWDIVDFNAVKTIPVYESVEDLILLPYGRKFPTMNVMEGNQDYFITVGSKGYFRIWCASNGKLIYTHDTQISSSLDDSENQLNITQATFNPQLDIITTITAEHHILMYRMEDLKLNKQFVGHNDEVLDIKFVGSDESHILVATNSHFLKLFHRESFTCELLKGHTDIVLAIDVFKKDKNMFASSGKDNMIRLWKMNPETFQVTCFGIGSGHTLSIGSLTCSKTSTKFVVSGSQDTTLKLWGVPVSDDTIATITPKITEKAHEKDINSTALSPNDKFIATGSQDKTIKMWSTNNGSLIGTLRGHRRGVWCVEFSPIDQVLASSSADGLIKIWAISDFSCVKTFEGHDSSVLKLTFLTRGMQLLSSSSDGMLKLWTIRQNECIKTLDGHEGKVWALAISSDEEYILTGAADSNIILWKDTTEAENNEKLLQIEKTTEMEQELSNLLMKKKFLKALKLAINLNYPFRVLSIIKELIVEEGGKEKLASSLKSLRNDQIDCILNWCVRWNTSKKNCDVAQLVLWVILNNFTPEEFIKFPNSKSYLEGLISYTDRHFQRMKNLEQQVLFFEYVWRCTKLADNSS